MITLASKFTGILKNNRTKYFYYGSYYFIVAVLLFSGITKIIDPLPAFETIKLITVVPENLQIIIVTFLPVVEIGLAILMLLKIKPSVSAKRFSSEDGKLTLMAVTILFAIFLAFSIYGTIVGFESDCGCFGKFISARFSIWMVIRNLFFVVVSLLFIAYKNLSGLTLNKLNN